MGILKKKKPQKPEEKDTSSLDAAVSELTRQTEALLGKIGEEPKETKSEKPKLPKKQSRPAQRGKSFDIIHNPNRKNRLNATLKANNPTIIDKLPAHTDNVSVPLLEDHATKSYNELSQEPDLVLAPAISDTEKTPSKPDKSKPPVIQHREGKLTLYEPEEPTSKDQLGATKSAPSAASSGIQPKETARESLTFNEPEELDSSEAPEVIDSTEPENAEPVLAEVEKFDSAPKEFLKAEKESEADRNEEAEDIEAGQETEDKSTTVEDEPKDDTKNQNELEETPKVAPDKKDKEEKLKPSTEDAAYSSGELFANNLVKESKPKGYQAPSKDGPAVFDTEEYHPELHDWSKLEHGNGSKWLLLFLVIIAAAAGYYLLSNTLFI